VSALLAVLLEKITGALFGGGATTQVATGGVKGVALAALLAGYGAWLLEHKDEVFVTLTYGEVTFWGALFCLVVYLALHLPSPRQQQGPPS
jgi:hypothetical protein